MKKVYLVRESGERLGPYERDEDGFIKIPYHDTVSSFCLAQLNILGFRIEPIPEQKVTIIREQFESAAKSWMEDFSYAGNITNLWFRLMTAASK